MERLKLFEEFDESEIIVLPGDEDYEYIDLEDEEEFDEYKNEVYSDLKYSSERILPIIDIDNETEWFKLVNNISLSANNEELQDTLTELRTFLSNFDVKGINDVFEDL